MPIPEILNANATNSRGKTILAVDDSATMRDMLFATLSSLGHHVVQAVDGVDALNVLRDQLPDVIITDLNMPRMDGIGLIEYVRQDAQNTTTPILVLTTESDPQMKARARSAGATGWIQKPFNPEKLAEAIRRVTA
jgi:two-component system, chemotaxis family, chemotaxis protein CheY